MSQLRRVAAAALVLAAGALSGAVFAQEPESEPPVTAPGRLRASSVDRVVDLPLTVALAAQGPLLAVRPMVLRLGGDLKRDLSGEGYYLTVEDTEIIFGPGSSSITRGTEILPLSQPPIETTSGVLAPLDFFDRVWGDLLGYGFDWDPVERAVTLVRPEAVEVGLEVDLVHLQGVTTVVLRFSERPRFRVEDVAGGVEVQLVGASLAPEARQPEVAGDPLVTSVDVGRFGVRLNLARDTTADNYTLENPFRLVFDIHREVATARPAPALKPPTPREGVTTIVLDPGHGGEETGAIGPSGAAEKDLTLVIAQALKARLQARMPVRVVLTRNEDASLPLESRTAMANQHKADLFLSIHLNSAAGTGARGAETFFLSLQATDERAAQAAETENRYSTGTEEPAADGNGEADPLYDLQLILWDLAQSHHLAESQRLARLIQGELNGALGLRDRGVKQAPFQVLMGAAMPAVLVELGFLSNPAEEDRLQDPAYRAQLVDALVRAITRYRAQVEDGEVPAEVARAGDGAASGDGDGGNHGNGEPPP